MDIRFNNRTVLVSGGAQGIGRAICVGFRDAGARVHVVDRDPRIMQVGQELGITAHVADLSDQAAAAGVVRAVVAAEGRLDVLALAAGGPCGLGGLQLAEINDANWDRIMDANVKTGLWLSQAAAPEMAKNKWGRIVIVSSGAGLRASRTGLHAYTAAKHAAIGLTRQLSVGLGPLGITANTVAPGLILSGPDAIDQWNGYSEEKKTQVLAQLSTGRLGEPEDIAHAVMFLASEQASWITGQVLPVEGGRP
ncbi:SDR family oxidoreductase [Rhodovarius crocodyli]|uniref:SDR family oxidoreductase n=1 Tax=Rhodovarius crocodyli TaxID=1979269 RepID=A0A437MJX4_9PROT|nr:SDR family oxidoreductase [Rhodovarius crocodyli]RVT97942.1 SDR family oxidoreductase [Rhodovarius crocodyli]